MAINPKSWALSLFMRFRAETAVLPFAAPKASETEQVEERLINTAVKTRSKPAFGYLAQYNVFIAPGKDRKVTQGILAAMLQQCFHHSAENAKGIATLAFFFGEAIAGSYCKDVALTKIAAAKEEWAVLILPQPVLYLKKALSP